MNTCSIIILAAGKGERMEGIRPKVLYELDSKPLIDHVLKTAYQLQPERIVVVVGFEKEKVMDFVTQHAISHSVKRYNDTASSDNIDPIDIRFAIQNEQLGTGHAVLQAQEMFADFQGDILILSGDVPLISTETLSRLLKNHLESGAGATVLTANYKNPKGYGRIVFDEDGSLQKIVEDKDATHEEKKISVINTGIFVFHSDHLFTYLHNVNRDNAQAEYYITDLIQIIQEHSIKVSAFQSSNPKETYGINTPEQLAVLSSMLPTS